MPAYKNTGTQTVVIGPLAIAPGQTVETELVLEYYDPTLAGGLVVRLSDEPAFSPVVQSFNVQLSAGREQTLEPLLGGYKVLIVVSGGPVELYFNGQNPPLIAGGHPYPVRHELELETPDVLQYVLVRAQADARLELHVVKKRLAFESTFSPKL